jgi:hypothetical protein
MKFMSSNSQIAPINVGQDLVHEDLASDVFAGDVSTMTPFTNSRIVLASTLDPDSNLETARRPRSAGTLFLRRDDYRRLLPAGLRQPQAAARERALLPSVAEAQAAGFRPCKRCNPANRLHGADLWMRFVRILKRTSTGQCGSKNWGASPA